MSVIFPIYKEPGPHSSISEFLRSTILRPKKPLGNWNLVNPLLRMNEAWTDEYTAGLQSLADQYKTPTTLNFRNKKILSFDRYNPIMSGGQKHLSLKKRNKKRFFRKQHKSRISKKRKKSVILWNHLNIVFLF